MKRALAVLAAALLAGLLPVVASSQQTQAPADAFVYIIWPPDGATVKGAFWCRFGLDGKRLPVARPPLRVVAEQPQLHSALEPRLL